MIKERLLFMTAHAYLDAYVDFAKAYGTYNNELKRAKRKIAAASRSVLDECEVSKTLVRKANVAAAKLFELNGLCKRAYGQGFIVSDRPIVKNKEKEDLINKAYYCLTSDYAKKERAV